MIKIEWDFTAKFIALSAQPVATNAFEANLPVLQ